MLNALHKIAQLLEGDGADVASTLKMFVAHMNTLDGGIAALNLLMERFPTADAFQRYRSMAMERYPR